jgi:hypothetical protein
MHRYNKNTFLDIEEISKCPLCQTEFTHSEKCTKCGNSQDIKNFYRITNYQNQQITDILKPEGSIDKILQTTGWIRVQEKKN